MTQTTSFFQRVLWPPMPASRLAALRILIGGYALYVLAGGYGLLLGLGDSNSLYYDPVGVVSLLGRWPLNFGEPLAVDTFRYILIAALALNVAFVLGWRFLFTGPLFAAFLWFVLSYRNSWSMIYHSSNLLVLHTAILALAPSANAWSLDALGRSRFWLGGTWPRTASDPDWPYGWAVQLIGAITTLTYFLAGIAKVAGPVGWSWATGAAFRTYLTRDGLRKEILGDGAPEVMFWLLDQEGLLGVFAVLTLIIELGAPLVLLHRRAGRAWAVLAFGMHWAILFIMGITFDYQLCGLAFLSFFPVEKVPGFMRRSPNRSEGRT